MLQLRGNLAVAYDDVLTREALDALNALATLDVDRRQLMQARLDRRAERQRRRERIAFLEPNTTIGRTSIRVQDARDGKFAGSEIPADLQRQWIQGTGPAAKPDSRVEKSIRNVAYALLSGADGWMFDGEDALGQVSTMSLDNQRNLKLAIHRDAVFLTVAETGRRRDEPLGARVSSAARSIDDWRQQLRFHDEDLPRPRSSSGRSARAHAATAQAFRRPSSTSTLYVVQQPASAARRRLVARPLPAENPDGGGGGVLERHALRRWKRISACRRGRSRPTCSSSSSRRAFS